MASNGGLGHLESGFAVEMPALCQKTALFDHDRWVNPKPYSQA